MEAADSSIPVEKTSTITGSSLQKLDSYWDEVEGMPVPETIPNIDLNDFPENHRIDMFNLARDAWVDIYNPATLLTHLQSDEVSNDKRRELKDLRKHGLVLRAAYKSLDGRHMAPQKHWLFLKLLGELNDNYYSPQRVESKEKLADFVEKQYMSLDGLEFFSATNKSFQDHYNKELALVNKLNDEDVLPAHDFHLMRKLLRNSMNTFRLSGTLTHDPKITQVARYMQDLNETLGKKQDQLVQQDIRGELAYGDAAVIVPPEEKRKIQGFVRANVNV